jgi:hypothetical protein
MQSERSISIILAALAAACLAFLNLRHPVLRLAYPYANVVALWLLLLLPVAAAIVALNRLRRWARWLMLALAACVFACTGPVLFLVTLGLVTTPIEEPDPSFMPLHRSPLPRGGSLVAYLEDCGAPCSFSVVVRQERALVPGLLLVRNVYVYGEIDDASVQIMTPEWALVNGQEVHLLRWVYW